MNQPTPPGGIAPHIPADEWRRAQATGQPVVIVVDSTAPAGIAWRRVLIPFAITGAAVAGGWGLVTAICVLLDAAAHTATVITGAAGPIGIGGITLKLARAKNT
ncbi:hypothetical protein AR457_18540 [Streptomyces agglomeratus]|uniref:hypothetical protein n=1 Tax=Streptomyces agglomeratus TaxID=285458 RepID=UPI000854BC37|nr:hypothetical protein [Streptomyces agglomeratus]OEJ39780.1 hypothetical protein BGK70_18110 [Streptomyces agglomeratus]OEJ45839.1 hypothetical protein AR457_18540 [Streptomyces agglomeratus]